MTNFFLLSSLGYLFLAIVAILDKFILTKSLSTGTYTFYSTIFFFGAFLMLPFTTLVEGQYVWWGIISSLTFGLAAWPMYIGMNKGEATHIVPFIGATTTIFVFLFSNILLGETLSDAQLWGIILLVIASIIFAHDSRKKLIYSFSFLKNGYGWALVSGILFGLSHVTAKIFYTEYDFITGLVWTKGFAGVIAFITLFSITTRKELLASFGKNKESRELSKSNNMVLVVIDKIMAIAGTVLIQYAIAVGSVVMVNALVGLQYALVLLFVYILTRVTPKVFSEHFTKKEIGYEIFAILLVVAGIILLV